ncbi:uncharacterized protein [Epargyreus clarus]|uniref:uncharacterized protein n=1 Tax=Epargyreus clarus TaxID=520877 RepID=UPI003C2D95BD
MFGWLSLFGLVLWNQGLVEGIRLLELRVPAHAPEGGAALLGCQYDLEGDQLYSVKWYKNQREFYRYVPNNRVPTSHFPTPGITVDITRSSSTVVALTHLTQASAGRYRCEVSGEAPMFATVYEEKDITIHYLPKTGPRISGLMNEYDIGDRVMLNCTSSGSRPEAHLKWLINDRPVVRDHVRGPWYRVSRERMSTTETILELRFTIMPKHFKKGVLSIKCQAVIAPLYQDDVVHQILWNDNYYSTIASPVEIFEENQLLPSPALNEMKSLGFPPLPTSEEITDNASQSQAHLPCIVLIALMLRFIL